jgi:predicted DNA-binding transcriptional regulator AlpA
MDNRKHEALIGPDEAARRLGIKSQTLYTWRYRGKGPKSYNVGGSVKYRPFELDAWLERNATPAE